jgi:CHAT domain-containing protein
MTLPRGEVAVIAPRDSGLSAQQEVNMLQRVGLSVKRVEARLKEVFEFLESSGCPGVHVVSHGIFNLNDVEQAELHLEKPPGAGEPEKLYPKYVNGRRANFGQAKSLVFLNACNCGRSDFTYWGLGGWANAMVLKAECSAFLAPFWEVADIFALPFAEAFYLELLAGKTVGEAVQAGRQAIKQTGNPTWLAYCLYGHPKARLRG